MFLVRKGQTAKARTYMKPDLQEVSHQPLVCSITTLSALHLDPVLWSFAIW